MENGLTTGWMLFTVSREDNSSMTIDLRAVTEDDADFLYSVYASTRADEMARVDWNTEQQEAFLRMQFNAQTQFYIENYPGAEFHVITLNEQPIGRLYVHRKADEIRIMDISLLPDHRNLGVGSALLQDILEHGKNLNLPVSIHVEQFNPAMHLYKRMGFHPKEDKGVYVLMEWSSTNEEEPEHD
ncbi:MAG TPA: GNAT family N-acetyltransferase [Anaerolineales bacterium]|jgi:GNAT superfamily N-acetyltransferase|nr:GNAT family N-acetyltransferase [Anaerolineales bacterium]